MHANVRPMDGFAFYITLKELLASSRKTTNIYIYRRLITNKYAKQCLLCWDIAFVGAHKSDQGYRRLDLKKHSRTPNEVSCHFDWIFGHWPTFQTAYSTRFVHCQEFHMQRSDNIYHRQKISFCFNKKKPIYWMNIQKHKHTKSTNN